ncbi:MAG: metallophosphoesterase, partial [Actinomycetes bacterium]
MTATVLQLSDTHLVRERGGRVMGQDPDERLDRVLAAWSATRRTPDLVILTGDNADDGSPAAYRRLHAAVSALGAPLLVLGGNHDDPDAMGAVFGTSGTAEVDGWRLVAVNSAVADQVHGTVDAVAVADRLDRLDGRPTVVGIHHPPRSRSTHPFFRLEGADQLLDVLAARPHVRALVTGHLHDAFELAGPGGLQLLGAPSTLAAIAHDGDRYTSGADAPTGARVLVLADDGSL